MRPQLHRFTLAIVLLVCHAHAIAQGKTLIVSTPADPQHLNPAITTASHTHAVADSLFNGLVALDREMRPQPDLAERWVVSPDGRSVTFTLAKAHWHDGKPVTAEDVRFSFENILLKHHARTSASLKGVIERIEARDAQTVVFHLKRPYAPLLQQLDVTEAPILPRHVYDGADPTQHPANLKPVGSGPFKLAEYRRDDAIVLVKNPAYFKPGLPKLDRLVFRVLPEPRAEVQALIKGEVDFVRSVAGAEIETLSRLPNIKLDRVTAGPGGGNCVMTMVFNLDRPAFKDVRVRQAIAQGIDRQRILRDVIFGQGRVAAAPISSGIAWAHDANVLAKLPFDAQAAAHLLDAAGLKPDASGQRLKLDIVHFPQFARYAQAMRQDLAALGIALESRPYDRAAMIDAMFTKRDFDTGLVSYCNGPDPEIGVRRMFASDAIGPVPFSNGAAYRSAEVDRLFADALTTTDLAKRGTSYRAIQAIVVRELPYWWLVETDSPVAWRASFDGFAPWRGQFAEGAFAR
ncbi:MAG: solute-binding transporter (periplasmic) [Proteobacteria bacterium]|nr:solute-binding transporter (periplasmic) [Pseudomonadota bacterium]